VAALPDPHEALTQILARDSGRDHLSAR
jgi:hypothetical protein